MYNVKNEEKHTLLQEMCFATSRIWNRATGFCENFPKIFITLQIVLTVPVSVASGERRFSKLKLIKKYLRSMMSQESLMGLAVISIENQIPLEIEVESIIKNFAEKRSS